MSVFRYIPPPLKNLVLKGLDLSRWTAAAWLECARDLFYGPKDDPGSQAVIDAGLRWLCLAQDHTASKDRGIARHFSLLTGWANSYPETTGYAIPTLLAQSRRRNEAALSDRAKHALDWLLSIQFENGAFQGGTVGVTPVHPVTFDTGQILMGLAAGAVEFGEPYTTAMRRAADWLVSVQSKNGAWDVLNPHLTTHLDTARTFETHVAWGLLEAARAGKNHTWSEAGLANIRWALMHQQPNGWFAHCCLTDSLRPLTHTIAYALRGVIEGYRFSHDPALLEAALRTAGAMEKALQADGFLPGRFNQDWSPAVNWACLTGTAQTAICWLMLHEEKPDSTFLNAARIANRYVRRTISLDGPPETLGAVKGSFPIWGRYGRFEYLNWACKFMIDANTLEIDLEKAAACNLALN
ncbi:MAG: terpene cyclase/mutase family protein [Verrucomicrobiaceae bacterium]|nr:terpene cyclase/mutase family protein [Verrucomicrobiaceae bacterium]